MERRVREKKTMKNDDGCRRGAQPTSKVKEIRPTIRINKSKGKMYVQVKGISGEKKWYSLGQLDTDTLDIARRLVNHEWRERTDKVVNEISEKYPVPKAEQPKEIEDLRPWEADQELDWRAQEKFREILLTSFKRERELNKKALRKLARKIAIKKGYMRKEAFDEIMKQDPDIISKEARELRDEVKKAYDEGRLILK